MKAILILLSVVLAQSSFAFDHLNDTNLECRAFPQDGSVSGSHYTFYFAGNQMDESRDADFAVTFFSTDSANLNGSNLSVTTHGSGGFEFDYDTEGYTLDLNTAAADLKSSAEFKVQLHMVRIYRSNGLNYPTDSDAYCHFVAKYN